MPDGLISWVKSTIVGVALGALIAAVLALTQGIGLVDVLTQQLVQHAFGDVTQLISSLGKAGAPEWLVQAAGFAIGPGLPYTAGAASAVVAVPMLRLKKVAGRPLVEHGWPGPPDFLDRHLEVAGADPTDPASSPRRRFGAKRGEGRAPHPPLLAGAVAARTWMESGIINQADPGWAVLAAFGRLVRQAPMRHVFVPVWSAYPAVGFGEGKGYRN